MEYQHASHGVHPVVYYIKWSPKSRRKVLVGPTHDRLKEILEQELEENAWKVLKLAIQPNQVQVYLRANPYRPPTAIARTFKGRSSHVVREEFPQLKRMPSVLTRSTLYSTARNVSSEMMAHAMARQART